MEDMIEALLDVVRAQHSAAEGTDEAPFNMDDVVDMALNIMGRPDEADELNEMVKRIEDTVTSLAPDIFPPKTFEELDDSEQAASAASMIEQSLAQTARTNADRQDVDSSQLIEAYRRADDAEEEEDDSFSPQQAADLNDMIYQNIMQMMGMQEPNVEFPFDRSQIRYGQEKTVTEMLEEEAGAKAQEEEKRPLSAWELAQSAIDADVAAHTREEYVPKPMEMPDTVSASQLAAEAIAKSREEDRMKSEIEKRAEALMEEAKKLGKDPMAFALHQQEILNYMEKNSDELVSFEDFEDLSPEEKLEIERAMEEERRAQSEDGQTDTQASENVASEVPAEPSAETPAPSQPDDRSRTDDQATDAPAEEGGPEIDEELLRRLSAEVLSANSSEILADNADADMESINEEIMKNIRLMMSNGQTTVSQDSVEDLLKQAEERQESLSGGGSRPEESSKAEESTQTEESTQPEDNNQAEEIAQPEEGSTKEEESAQAEEIIQPEESTQAEEIAQPEEGSQSEVVQTTETPFVGVSAADLARAAQAAAGIKQPEEGPATKSAVEIAKEAQEAAKKQRSAEPDAIAGEGILSDEDLDLGDFDLDEDTDRPDPAEDQALAASDTQQGTESEEDTAAKEVSGTEEEEGSRSDSDEDEVKESASDYDPDEYVLGMHTQAEVDEALDNLMTLGLEGEVFDRAKRMLLLELAGSEAELDEWLKSQAEKESRRKGLSALDEADQLEDLSDLAGLDLEAELDEALDEEFHLPEEEDQPSDEPEAVDQADSDETVVEPTPEAGLDDVIEEEDVLEPESVVEEEAEDEEEVKADSVTTAKKGKKKNVVHKKDRTRSGSSESEKTAQTDMEEPVEKDYQVSLRTPFILRNSTSYIDKFKDYIVDTQENRKLSTGFKRLDAMLRYGLHKGTYFIDSNPQHLKNMFMQQIADRSAEGGVDVLFISTELSRYDMMVETISRLSFEINGKDPDKAVSAMAIMTGEEGADLDSLADELNWYRGRISEHLFIFDQESVDEFLDDTEDISAGVILEELIRSIVRDGAHKPVVFIDNIENILSVSDSADMKPLMEGIGRLARELGIPILLSYGYAPEENVPVADAEEREFRVSLGNMCDVYLELTYADMITEDNEELTPDDIREMSDDGDTLLVDIRLHRNRRPSRAGCQIQVTPKFNHFEE